MKTRGMEKSRQKPRLGSGWGLRPLPSLIWKDRKPNKLKGGQVDGRRRWGWALGQSTLGLSRRVVGAAAGEALEWGDQGSSLPCLVGQGVWAQGGSAQGRGAGFLAPALVGAASSPP